MILTTSIKLEAVLSGAITTSQPEYEVDYIDYNNDNAPTFPSPSSGALNNTTDVEILGAPVNNPRREVLRISIYNKDTVSATVTVKRDDGTERILKKVTLLTLESLNFEKGRGWYCLDANGNLKEVTASVFSSLTVTGLTTNRIPVTGTNGLLGDFAALTYTGAGGLILNNLLDISGASGGQIKFPASQNASANANTLDDYEEGTFTPAAAFGGGTTGITYGTQSGAYTKIGNQLGLRIRLTLTSNGSSTGNFTITDLPFALAGSPSTAFAAYASNLTGTSGGVVATVTSGTTMNVFYLGTGTATLLSDTTVTDTGDFIITGIAHV